MRSPGTYLAGQLASDPDFCSPVSPHAQGFAGSAVPSGSVVKGNLYFFLFLSLFNSQQQLPLRSWQVPRVSDRRQY